MTGQLFLFDPEPDSPLPDLRRRTLSESELAVNLRRLQAVFDARSQSLHRCSECHGFVEFVDTKGICPECSQPVRSTKSTPAT